MEANATLVGTDRGGAGLAPGGPATAYPAIATPHSQPPLLNRRVLPTEAARFVAWLARAWSGPIRLGSVVLAVRHADVMEVLRRDLDFRIAPVNAARIEAVNGPFVLGMDRSPTLAHERRALYQALGHVDMRPLQEAVTVAAVARLNSGDSIDVVNGYSRPIAAQTAAALFGIGGPAGEPPGGQQFMDVARAIFGYAFLDDGNDTKARALNAAVLMRAWFEGEIARRRAAPETSPPDMMGALMRDPSIDDDTVRRTLGGMLVGSIDTTSGAVTKIIATLCADAKLMAQVTADVDHPTRLAGWCWDVLRRWTHTPVVLRRAAADTTLGGVSVRAGDMVIAWTQAAMQDPSVFPEPSRMRPDRPREGYLHFGGGLHPCAGRVVNAFQIPILVGSLLRCGITQAGKMEWAGGFPDRLVVRLRGRAA